MTADLSGIRSLLAGITPGPWVWSEEADEWGDCGPNLETVERGPVYSDGSQGAKETVIGSWGHDANGISVEPNDAAFIAAAPSTVARLLGIVERVEAELAATDTETDEALQADLVTRIRAAINGEGGA